jgi:hypothetical protein
MRTQWGVRSPFSKEGKGSALTCESASTERQRGQTRFAIYGLLHLNSASEKEFASLSNRTK